MEFKDFNKLLQSHFAEMTKNVSTLFVVDVNNDEMWNLYLDSFPSGTNNIFRVRREFDCSCCRHFIRDTGAIVKIQNGVIETLWDFESGSTTYQPVIDALSAYVKSKPIIGKYMSKFRTAGTAISRELNATGVVEWNHFFLDIPSAFVTNGSIPSLQSDFVAIRNVFFRSLSEISTESVEIVLELIAQNSLYRGAEWETQLKKFLAYKNRFDALSDPEQALFAWEYASEAGVVIGKIKNHSIGVLLTDITAGVDLDDAVKSYERIIAPTNYKRPKEIFTQKMLDAAKEEIISLGYMDSLARRFANLDDINVNDILFADRDVVSRIDGSGDVFADMSGSIGVDPKKFAKIEEVSMEKFVDDILPSTKSVELLLENGIAQNMVSLIAPANANAKSMFKWGNPFSWAYTGNIADSNIAQNVKLAGGRIDGALRFSIQWNDTERDGNDLDAHCITPANTRIYFGHKQDGYTGGALDVDIIHPSDIPAVENIVWPELRKMADGAYKFMVNCYSNRGGRSGFRAEIEFNGQRYDYDYVTPMRGNETIEVATVTLKNGNFTIEEKLPSTISTREVWGLKTNQFIPVTVIMSSPNFWNGAKQTGNKHHFFMLRGCVNPEMPNGFFNEFIVPELEKHKHVLAALGSKMAVVDAQDQLSGVGFSTTKHTSLVVKVVGATTRILKINI